MWNSKCWFCCSQLLLRRESGEQETRLLHPQTWDLPPKARLLPSGLTCAAAARSDACPPVFPVPVGPHGLNLVDGGGSPHAVEALPRSVVRQGAVGARTVSIEAETVVRHNAGRRLGVGAHRVSPAGGWKRRVEVWSSATFPEHLGPEGPTC